MEFVPDSIVQSVIQQFLGRAKFGKAKYGTDLDRTDLSMLDWIQHAQEEHMDAILYLEKMKHTYIKEQSATATANTCADEPLTLICPRNSDVMSDTTPTGVGR